VLELLQQISGLAARVNELVAQNKALLVRIAELQAERGKPPKTPEPQARRMGPAIPAGYSRPTADKAVLTSTRCPDSDPGRQRGLLRALRRHRPATLASGRSPAMAPR
jgi:hypothetical protein